MKKIFYSLIILLFSIYILLLNESGKLDFYIHPRYDFFTTAAAIISLILMFTYFIFSLKEFIKSNKKFNFNIKEFSFSLVLLIPLALGFLLPVKQLSSNRATQVLSNFNSLSSTEVSTLDLYTSDTKNYSLGDWIISINSNPVLEDYINSKVKVSGFVFTTNELSDSYFIVSRFVVTCCAVDARPVGLYVQYEWKNEFSVDEWVEVTGKFEIKKINNREELVIIPENIKLIDVPEDPYIN